MTSNGKSNLLLESGGALLLESLFNLLLEEDSGTTLTNNTATAYWSNANTVCQRSGRKVKPGTLVREPVNNLWVHPDYVDPAHPQIFGIRDKAEKKTGSVRPEPASDYFITTAISAEDL